MTDLGLELIVTQGPYSSFMEELARLDLVTGIRLNTVMPVKEGRLKEKLEEMHGRVHPKTLWIDLKARQLRVREFANTPYTAVTISHRIQVRLPALAYFDNGRLTGRIVDIDDYRLILDDYVGRLIGPGESVNIVDESLTYLDPEPLTALDRTYVELARELGLGDYMFSYVETAEDVQALRRLHPGCRIMAKIENMNGLAHLEAIAATADEIMAARGDLYTEIPKPHRIGQVLAELRRVAGIRTVAASRLLESLLVHPVPSCADMMDVGFLWHQGYRRFMIGDDLSFKRDLVFKAVRIMAAMARDGSGAAVSV